MLLLFCQPSSLWWYIRIQNGCQLSQTHIHMDLDWWGFPWPMVCCWTEPCIVHSCSPWCYENIDINADSESGIKAHNWILQEPMIVYISQRGWFVQNWYCADLFIQTGGSVSKTGTMTTDLEVSHCVVGTVHGHVSWHYESEANPWGHEIALDICFILILVTVDGSWLEKYLQFNKKTKTWMSSVQWCKFPITVC